MRNGIFSVFSRGDQIASPKVYRRTGRGRRLTAVAIGALVSIWASAPALANEAERAGAVAATERKSVDLAWVVQNTDTFIATLVNQWQAEATRSGSTSTWSAEFAQALRATTPERLLRIQAAANYNEVRAILQGRQTPVNLRPGSIQDLGDTLQDLTFTPVNPPCRIFDSRNYGGGAAPLGGTTRNYLVYGTGAQMTAQGGNAAGCAAPKGEPVGVAANFTIANPSGQGHIRVFPFGGTLPTVSFVNFLSTSGSVANSGIVSTCFLCGSDLSVFNAVTVHHIGDVMGYFYPAEIGLGIETRFGGYDIGVATVSAATTAYPGVFVGSTNGTSTITVEAGDEVMWMSSAMVFRDAGVNNRISGSFKGCYRNVSGGAITQMPIFESETDFIVPSTGSNDQKAVNGGSRATGLTAGTYEFGFCAIAGSSFGGALDSYTVSGVKHHVLKIRR